MWTPMFDEFGKDFTVIALTFAVSAIAQPATGYDKNGGG